MPQLLAEPILIVRRDPRKGQRPEYRVFDRDERLVGRGVYVPDDEVAAELARYGLGHRTAAALRVADVHGATVFTVAFPGWRARSVLLISDAKGQEVGEAIKTKGVWRVSYELRHATRRVGAIQVMDRRQRRVVVTDDAGAEVAVARTITDETPFTVTGDGDGYYVEIHPSCPQPLRSLVVASSVALQAAIGSEAAVGETEVLKLPILPRFLDPLRRG